MTAVREALPEAFTPRHVLDLGCGSGRFTSALAELFRCPIVGVDPSAAMLEAARDGDAPLVSWSRGEAERIPFPDSCVDVVFMSQVFHHLKDPAGALSEIRRVLGRPGYLLIRNATYENNEAIPWLSCFPESLAIERSRILPREALNRRVCGAGFELVVHRTVQQAFAASPTEYLEKVRARGLSSLVLIDDRAFEAGLARFQEWIYSLPQDEPVLEPVDLFAFRIAPAAHS